MMNKKNLMIILVVCLMMLISGCLSKERNYESYTQSNSIYTPETDYQYYLHQQLYNQRITEAEHGYYMLNGSYIYYMDKEAMEPILLDNNPNNDCNPSSVEQQVVNCNAYVELGSPEYRGILIYYKDSLYTVVGGMSTDKDTFGQIRYELIKMNKDGTARKSIRKFDYTPRSIAIHRDQLYFTLKGPNDKGITVERVVAVPLREPNSEPKVLYAAEYNDLNLNDIIPYGNYVYFTESGRNMYRTVQYSIEQEKASIMYKEYDGNINIDSRIEDNMIFSIFTGDVRDKHSWKTYTSNMNGEEVTELPLHLDILSHVYADTNYLYQVPIIWYTKNDDYNDIFSNIKEEMLIYDWAYELVHSIDISFVPRSYNVINGNDQYMFLRIIDSETEKLYYLDKSQIASKKAQFKLLIETAKR